MEYAIIITGGENGYVARVPDLEDCRAEAATREGALELVREEIKTSIKASVEPVIENAMEEEDPVPEQTMSLSDAMTGDFVEYAPEGMEVTIVMVDVDVKVVVEVESGVKAEVKVNPGA